MADNREPLLETAPDWKSKSRWPAIQPQESLLSQRFAVV